MNKKYSKYLKLFSNLNISNFKKIIKRNDIQDIIYFCQNCDELKLNYYTINNLFPNIPANELFTWKIIDKKTFPPEIIKINLKNINIDNFKFFDEYFIYKSLITSENIYEHYKLFELFSPYYVIKILNDENINFNLLPNFENLLKIALTSNFDKITILEKIIKNNNYSSLSIFIDNCPIEILNNNIQKIIQFLNKNDFNISKYIINRMNPKTIINLVNNEVFYNNYLKKLNDDQLNSLFNGYIVDEFNKNEIYKIIDLYSDYVTAIITNNKLYEKSNYKQSINFWTELISKINSNPDFFFKIIDKSNAILDFFNGISYNNNSNNNIEIKYMLEKILDDHSIKVQDAVLKNYNSLVNKIIEYSFSNNNIFNIFIHSKLMETKNLINPYNGFSNYLDYFLLSKEKDLTENEINLLITYLVENNNSKTLFNYFDKFPILKTKIINNYSILKNILNKFPKFLYFEIFNSHPEFLQKIVNNAELLNDYIFIFDEFSLLNYLEKYPQVSKKLINSNTFIHTILANEQKTFEYLTLLNKYNITNENVNKFNKGFNQIQKVRNELSLKNSSLKKEMLYPEFISILGVEYINAILEYDSEATNIVVELFNTNNLSNLRKYLDFLTNNIKNTRRMIHFYILAFNSTNKLVFNLIDNCPLTDYQKQILEEIIANNNKYEIQNINQLNNYFLIKSKKILSQRKKLTSNDVLELFLNQSARDNGEPWNIPFFKDVLSNQELEYFKYKYVDSGTISLQDYEYILAVNNILKNNCDMELIKKLLNDSLNKEVPSIRSLYKKMEQQYQKDFNDRLLDLDEIRAIGSYTDSNADVYITKKNGVEIIYLNGYDYKFIGTALIGNKATYEDEDANDRNINYNSVVLSEKLKQFISNGHIKLETLGGIIKNNPIAWNLLEGVSTISAGGISSRFAPSKNYGWGKKSDIRINGTCDADGKVSHKLRDLKPGGIGRLNIIDKSCQVLYSLPRNWSEVWFDRNNPQQTNNNQRIQPEFIILEVAEIGDDISNNLAFTQAKTFNCPIVVRVNSKYEHIEEQLYETAIKKYTETYDKNCLYDIWYNSKIDNLNKLNFLLNILNESFKNGILSLDNYILKLTDLKWFLYENDKKYVPNIEKLLSEIKNMNIDSIQFNNKKNHK